MTRKAAPTAGPQLIFTNACNGRLANRALPCSIFPCPRSGRCSKPGSPATAMGPTTACNRPDKSGQGSQAGDSVDQPGQQQHRQRQPHDAAEQRAAQQLAKTAVQQIYAQY